MAFIKRQFKPGGRRNTTFDGVNNEFLGRL
jgi:hypothetical protein